MSDDNNVEAMPTDLTQMMRQIESGMKKSLQKDWMAKIREKRQELEKARKVTRNLNAELKNLMQEAIEEMQSFGKDD